MALIARDLMVGNPKLAEMGFGEEALGHNAIAAGFQGQRQWTDHFPNGDFMEAILNSSFDWNGMRAALHRRHRKRLASTARRMLFGYLLTNTAQIFADVRTYWSPDADRARHRLHARGHRLRDGIIHLHQLRRRHPGRHRRSKDADGKPAMKPCWEITDDGVEAMPRGHHLAPGHHRTTSAAAASPPTSAPRASMPVTMIAPQPRRRPRPGAANRRRLHRRPARRGAKTIDLTHRSDLADHLVRAHPHRRGRLHAASTT